MKAKRNKSFLIRLLIIYSLSTVVASGQRNIRQIDFNNFTYSALCGGEKESDARKVTVKNGTLKNIRQIDGIDEPIDDKLPSYFDVNKMTYGDLTGDGKEEAIIETECNTGGTGVFTEGYIFTIKNSKPELISRIEGGSKAYGSLVSVRISKNILTVKRNDPREGAECCPQYTVTKKYKWNGKKFTLFGKPRLRKIVYPIGS